MRKHSIYLLFFLFCVPALGETLTPQEQRMISEWITNPRDIDLNLEAGSTPENVRAHFLAMFSSPSWIQSRISGPETGAPLDRTGVNSYRPVWTPAFQMYMLNKIADWFQSGRFPNPDRTRYVYACLTAFRSKTTSTTIREKAYQVFAYRILPNLTFEERTRITTNLKDRHRRSTAEDRIVTMPALILVSNPEETGSLLETLPTQNNEIILRTLEATYTYGIEAKRKNLRVQLAVIPFLRSRSQHIRKAAIRVLCDVREGTRADSEQLYPQSLSELASLIQGDAKSEDEYVRTSVIRVLELNGRKAWYVQQGSSPILDEVTLALANALDTDESLEVRKAAAKALKAIKPTLPKAQEALARAVNDRNEEVRALAADGLGYSDQVQRGWIQNNDVQNDSVIEVLCANLEKIWAGNADSTREHMNLALLERNRPRTLKALLPLMRLVRKVPSTQAKNRLEALLGKVKIRDAVLTDEEVLALAPRFLEFDTDPYPVIQTAMLASLENLTKEPHQWIAAFFPAFEEGTHRGLLKILKVISLERLKRLAEHPKFDEAIAKVLAAGDLENSKLVLESFLKHAGFFLIDAPQTYTEITRYMDQRDLSELAYRCLNTMMTRRGRFEYLPYTNEGFVRALLAAQNSPGKELASRILQEMQTRLTKKEKQGPLSYDENCALQLAAERIAPSASARE